MIIEAIYPFCKYITHTMCAYTTIVFWSAKALWCHLVVQAVMKLSSTTTNQPTKQPQSLFMRQAAQLIALASHTGGVGVRHELRGRERDRWHDWEKRTFVCMVSYSILPFLFFFFFFFFFFYYYYYITEYA